MFVKYLKKVLSIDLMISGIFFTILVTFTIFGVVMRYIFNNPITWLEEIQMVSIIWIVFFSGSAAFRTKSHVAIDIITDLLPEAGKRIANVILSVVILITLGFLGYQGIILCVSYRSMGRATDVLRIPAALMYSAVPIGCLFMILSFFLSLWERQGETTY